MLSSVRKSIPEKTNRIPALRKPPHKGGTSIACIPTTGILEDVMRIVGNIAQVAFFATAGIVMIYALLSVR